MTTTTMDGNAIMIGFEYRMQIEADVALFPVAGAFTADVRASLASNPPAATLTTANGGIVRVSDFIVEIILSAAVTGALAPGAVLIDFARTDIPPAVHLGFRVEIPVQMPVTRGV